MRRILRMLGGALVLLGAGAAAWSLVVWRWQDPATLLYTRHEQHRLAAALDSRLAASPAVRPEAAALARAARELRRTVHPGEPIGRLVVPRLGLSIVVVEGTDAADLRLGPGRDARSSMPGESNLVYVAGHRTTFAAPFAHLDALRPGDRIRLEMPYGVFTYVATGHSIVAAGDLSVLRPRRHELLALQACHPRFFATQRYIVWARLRTVGPRRTG